MVHALHAAADQKCTARVIDLLDQGASPMSRDEFGRTALHAACDLEMVDAYRVPDAARFNMDRILTVEAILARLGDDDVSARDMEGSTALHLACVSSSIDMAPVSSDVNVIAALLRRGAPIDAADRRGHTPLHIACDCGHDVDTVRLLLHHANPNLQSLNGWTALDCAEMIRDEIQCYMEEADEGSVHHVADRDMYATKLDVCEAIVDALCEHGGRVGMKPAA